MSSSVGLLVGLFIILVLALDYYGLMNPLPIFPQQPYEGCYSDGKKLLYVRKGSDLPDAIKAELKKQDASFALSLTEPVMVVQIDTVDAEGKKVQAELYQFVSSANVVYTAVVTSKGVEFNKTGVVLDAAKKVVSIGGQPVTRVSNRSRTLML